MKLGSLKQGGRDGTLIVVSRDLTRAVRVPKIAPTLQAAIEDWDRAAPELRSIYRRLGEGHAPDSFALDVKDLASPFPAPINGPTARPISTMSSWYGRRGVLRCRPPSCTTR